MSIDEGKPQDNLAARPSRPPAPVRQARPGGREVARARNLQPAPPAPSAPPAEAVPLAWSGTVQPAQVLLYTRRARRRRFFLRLGLISGLPTVLVLLYMIFVASPRYVSEFEITYQTYQPQQSLASGLIQSLLGTSISNNVDFSALLYEFIRSEPLLRRLDSELHLREYYSSPKVDYISRMNPNATMSVFMRYYLWYVSVSEGNGGYLTVDVQAFDPDYALKLAKAIVKAADEMVDAVTVRARQDEVRYAEAELRRTENRVRKARLAEDEFQNLHGDISPPTSASQLTGIVGTIEGSLAAARTQLAMLLATAPHSPQVAATKAQIVALQGQLKNEQNRLTGNSGGKLYSKLLDEYSALQLEMDFAKNDYMSAQQGLSVARADAARQENYLIDFVPPSRPDKQNIEFAVVYSLTALVTSLVIFAIGSLVGGALRDQAGL
jgi:capsular polysaccharide transport system permease protein